jgi:hypothetical protein
MSLGITFRKGMALVKAVKAGEAPASYTRRKTSTKTFNSLKILTVSIREHCDGTRECLSEADIAKLHFTRATYDKSPDKTMLKKQAAKLYGDLFNQSANLLDTFCPVPAEGKAWKKQTPTREEVLAAYRIGVKRPFIMYCPEGDALGDYLVEARLRIDSHAAMGKMMKTWEKFVSFVSKRPQLADRLNTPQGLASLFLGEVLEDQQLALQGGK